MGLEFDLVAICLLFGRYGSKKEAGGVSNFEGVAFAKNVYLRLVVCDVVHFGTEVRTEAQNQKESKSSD